VITSRTQPMPLGQVPYMYSLTYRPVQVTSHTGTVIRSCRALYGYCHVAVQQALTTPAQYQKKTPALKPHSYGFTSAVLTALPSETLHLHKQRAQEHRDKEEPSNMATTDEQKKAILPFLQVRHAEVSGSLGSHCYM
jgi:hypothetical protein